MAIPDFDPRNGGTCANIMAKKISCAVVAATQIIFWGIAVLTLIFKPSSAGVVVERLDTTSQVILNLIIITCFGFSCLLAAGIYKNNRMYVGIYMVYTLAFAAFLFVSLIICIFTQPRVLGFRGFLSNVIVILLFVFCFFMVRCYYLMAYSNTPRRQVVPNKV